MKTTLRKLGNSRGVLIPAPLLAACQITDAIELTVEAGRLIITPIPEPRTGWFDEFEAAKDVDAWEGAEDLASVEDWEW